MTFEKVRAGTLADILGLGFPLCVFLPLLYYTATPVRITSR